MQKFTDKVQSTQKQPEVAHVDDAMEPGFSDDFFDDDSETSGPDEYERYKVRVQLYKGLMESECLEPDKDQYMIDFATACAALSIAVERYLYLGYIPNKPTE
jgi:hypothetical protein